MPQPVIDRLVRYHRDLAKLANNFVAFGDFYNHRDKAIFQAMSAFGEMDTYDVAQQKIVAEMRLLAGDAAAQTVAGKFHEHGLDGCSDVFEPRAK